MSKFSYEDEKELNIANCQCELCWYYNNGKRSINCPKDLTKIKTNENWCPNIKTNNVFEGDK